MAAPQAGSRQHRQMDAGALAAEIASFRLHLAAEGKSPKTIQLYTEAVTWFAAARLLGQVGKTGWQHADTRDVQEWMAWLLSRYSDAYASNQYRALQQFFKWLSVEDDVPDPMAGLRPPKVTGKLVPVFADAELARLERTCAGRGFAERRGRGHHRGAASLRDPAVGAGRYPLRPGRSAPQRPRRVAAGDHRARQGWQAPHREDQLRHSPDPGPLSARSCQAPAGLAASAVAR
jgi:integrase